MIRIPRRTAARAAVVAALVLVASCSGAKEDPARRTVNEIAGAAEERDASAVVERLAPDFQAADGSGRMEAEATLRRYLAAYESLDVRISDVTIESAEGASRARFRADLSGKPRHVGGLEGFLPRSSAYRFDLRLAPADGGRWVVTWAAWEPAS